MPNPADLPQLLTMEELAERLGVTHRHVRRLVAERRVPFLRVGRFIRFDSTDAAEWLRSARVPATILPATEISPPRPLRVRGPVPRAEEQGGHL
jgi:excisionase family DNA binding protein